jgi:hypothetical protein
VKRAMVGMELWWRFRVIGADGVQVGYYCETETESPCWKFDKPAVRITLQVTQIVRFLLPCIGTQSAGQRLGRCGRPAPRLHSESRPGYCEYEHSRVLRLGRHYSTEGNSARGHFTGDDPALDKRQIGTVTRGAQERYRSQQAGDQMKLSTHNATT